MTKTSILALCTVGMFSGTAVLTHSVRAEDKPTPKPTSRPVKRSAKVTQLAKLKEDLEAHYKKADEAAQSAKNLFELVTLFTKDIRDVRTSTNASEILTQFLDASVDSIRLIDEKGGDQKAKLIIEWQNRIVDNLVKIEQSAAKANKSVLENNKFVVYTEPGSRIIKSEDLLWMDAFRQIRSFDLIASKPAGLTIEQADQAYSIAKDALDKAVKVAQAKAVQNEGDEQFAAALSKSLDDTKAKAEKVLEKKIEYTSKRTATTQPVTTRPAVTKNSPATTQAVAAEPKRKKMTEADAVNKDMDITNSQQFIEELKTQFQEHSCHGNARGCNINKITINPRTGKVVVTVELISRQRGGLPMHESLKNQTYEFNMYEEVPRTYKADWSKIGLVDRPVYEPLVFLKAKIKEVHGYWVDDVKPNFDKK